MYGSWRRRRQNFSAPARASAYSTRTVPRSRFTSFIEYVRMIPPHRGEFQSLVVYRWLMSFSSDVSGACGVTCCASKTHNVVVIKWSRPIRTDGQIRLYLRSRYAASFEQNNQEVMWVDTYLNDPRIFWSRGSRKLFLDRNGLET